MPPLVLLMPGSLNGEPGEELACPGVVPPEASMSWHDWFGGPVVLTPSNGVALGNNGGVITLLDPRGLKVHGVGTVALRRRASSPCLKVGTQAPQAPWRTVTNRAFEGLLRGFWAGEWITSGDPNAQCNCALTSRGGRRW